MHDTSSLNLTIGLPAKLLSRLGLLNSNGFVGSVTIRLTIGQGCWTLHSAWIYHILHGYFAQCS